MAERASERLVLAFAVEVCFWLEAWLEVHACCDVALPIGCAVAGGNQHPWLLTVADGCFPLSCM
jgi:hypothetical protein